VRMYAGVRMVVWPIETRPEVVRWWGCVSTHDRHSAARTPEECAEKLERRVAAWLQQQAQRLAIDAARESRGAA
jgi:hypothetical protein